MKIGFYIYFMSPLRALNRVVDPGMRQGALLRVEFSDGSVGYSDCHPWPELGDPDLEAQLRSLKNGQPLVLAQTSLDLARRDAQARTENRSLIDSSQIPKSHFLVTDIQGLDPQALPSVIESGYQVAKVKVGCDPTLEREALEKWLPHLNDEFRLRLDFNGALDAVSFRYWWDQLSDELKSRIDFVEDPTPFEPSLWSQFATWEGLTLARDRGSEELDSVAPVRVIKPAKQSLETFMQMAQSDSNYRFIFTTYMDHPLGQAAAIAQAIEFYKKYPQVQEVCGLQTIQLYEADAFSERVRISGPYLQWPEGPGLGFSDLLEKIRWEPLVSRDD